MNKTKVLLAALASLFVTACVSDDVVNSQGASELATAKMINRPESATKGILVVFVDEETAEAWSVAKEATRSGVEACDLVAAECGAEAIEPVFNMSINGDEKRAQNLHRWFVVSFDYSKCFTPK